MLPVFFSDHSFALIVQKSQICGGQLNIFHFAKVRVEFFKILITLFF